MENIKFIGCLHFGDEDIARRLRKFESAEQHDEHLIRKWNETTYADDTVYILGDIGRDSSKEFHKLHELNGNKIVVLGNHDRIEDVPELLKYVQGVCGMEFLRFQSEDGSPDADFKVWLSHAPLHPMELMHVDVNIHAHVHHQQVPHSQIDCDYWGKQESIRSGNNHKYFNVDAQKLDYQPANIGELIQTQNPSHNADFGNKAPLYYYQMAKELVIDYVAALVDTISTDSYQIQTVVTRIIAFTNCIESKYRQEIKKYFRESLFVPDQAIFSAIKFTLQNNHLISE